MQISRLSAHLSLAFCLGPLFLTSCLSDGECPAYDYEPASVRVSFRDVETGEPVCDQPNAANPGKLIPMEGACSYYLAGWYVRGDGGISTTVRLTVKGYVPVTVSFEAGTGECGEALPPPPRQIDVTPDPNAD